MVLLQSLPFKSQNGDVLFKSFYIGNEAFHKSNFCDYLLSNLMLQHWYGQKAYHVDGHLMTV